MYLKLAAAAIAAATIALIIPAAASATVFGEDLGQTPTMGNAGTGITRAYMADGSLNPGSPQNGILTSVTLRSTGEASWGWVRVLRRVTPFVSGGADFYNVSPLNYWEVTADASTDGHTTTIPTRIAIQAGDQLALVNANDATLMYFLATAPSECAQGASAIPGTTTTYSTALCNRWIPLVQGTVEADADGDGYGDDTQDECPTNAATQDDCPPVGTTFVGDDLDVPPAWALTGVTITRSLAEDGSDYEGFAVGGVLTEVQIFHAGLAGNGIVHVLRNTTSLGAFPIEFLNVGPDVPFAVATAGAPGAITSIPTRQRVLPGDRFGLTNNSGSTSMYYVSPGSGDCVQKLNPPPAPGAVASFTDASCNSVIPLVRGVVEPDTDGDGYGDVSQDRCPADATVHDICLVPAAFDVADLSVKISRAKQPVSGNRATMTVTIANKGPATAERVTITIDRARKLKSWFFLKSRACTRTRTKRGCSLNSLAPGARVTLKARAVKRMSGKIALVARVSSRTGDPVARNNKSTATIRFSR